MCPGDIVFLPIFPYLMDIMHNLSNSWAGESGGICNSKSPCLSCSSQFWKNIPKLYSNQLTYS